MEINPSNVLWSGGGHAVVAAAAPDLTERVYPGLSHNVSAAELADLAAFVQARI